MKIADQCFLCDDPSLDTMCESCFRTKDMSYDELMGYCLKEIEREWSE